MNLWLTTLVAVLAVATADDPTFRKQVDATFIEKQKQVLEIVSGISVHQLDSKYTHNHQDFTFDKPELFTDSSIVEKFQEAYKRGFLPRDGVFTLNTYKSRHDTFKLFELFYFAKDFSTFIDIAKWAKNEFNIMQFSYAFTIAVLHRSDCRGIYLPPAYEIYPHYFVPTKIMRQADVASFYDVEYRKFMVNTTGFEYSWYNDMTSGAFESHPRWVGDDVESRVSYFREDPGLSHWYSMSMARWATWLSPQKHPGVEFVKRGKRMYAMHKWLLSRYNLERMSAGMPFVEHFDWEKEVIGYNSHLSDYLYRPFTSRPDHMIPFKFNPKAFSYINKIEERIYEAIDHKFYYNFKNGTYIQWGKEEGLDLLGKMMFGERDGIGRFYYKPWFFLVMEALNDMLHSSNDRDYTNTVFGKYMTMARDPMFYQVLAAMDFWFESYSSSLPPYTPQELSFPGVKIQNVEFDKLMTYFENFEYEITQGVTFKKPEDRDARKYFVSQPRLNHKPFYFNLTVESERAQDSMIRVFFGPKKNIDFKLLSMNQARHVFYLAAYFPQKLKAGVNVISKNTDDLFHFENFEPIRSFKERMDKSEQTGKPFHINALSNCGVPSNLMLPRGSSSGSEYTAFVMIEPMYGDKGTKDQNYYMCNYQLYADQPSVTFPLDRPIHNFANFKQSNMMFKDVMIHHKMESDLNRSFSV